ncbi:ankyrin repeat domain-containing protein (plasmid) [Mesorhizobium sp. AR07]|uniref:ankyrin repeat domain-containing protein n=1 Tax=Mesorhizobium sp. AR07 TaxID=2865838 RepID=UPI002160FDC3|nr:ankyrin repeat domain-containing protein [Mesorhizobium sp. AR07]UVK49426.1 ankyrin repeat domain-containing protein [Mesorhizobium sp. AR07]
MKQTMMDDASLRRLMKAIASADGAAVLGLLTAFPALARATLKKGATRAAATDNFLNEIKHYVYTGDTALHVAAAAHRPEIARELISLGADVAARNRRGATPLHYAADGIPGSPRWNPVPQSVTVALLIASGADPNAIDQNGVTPLHRAVRTRCGAAASALLDGGADALRKNGNGSTPMMLATRQTGRGGSGSPEARTQQAEIIRLLERYGMTP